MEIPLFYVNAFTGPAFRGNPAAVCLLDSLLDDRLLRKVAAENNLSATAFLWLGNAIHELRWFTPRCEVRLCGHATLAAAYVVLNLLQHGNEFVMFNTRFGGTVSVRRDGNFLSMDFPSLRPEPSLKTLEKVTAALGLGKGPSHLLEVNDILVAVIGSQKEVVDLRPDFALLEELHPYAVLVTAPGEQADFVSRYFAPGYGVPEDPVTGSAHCVLTPYWANRLGKTRLHAQQLSTRGGELWCEIMDDRVLLKGTATLTMRGTLEI